MTNRRNVTLTRIHVVTSFERKKTKTKTQKKQKHQRKTPQKNKGKKKKKGEAFLARRFAVRGCGTGLPAVPGPVPAVSGDGVGDGVGDGGRAREWNLHARRIAVSAIVIRSLGIEMDGWMVL